MKRRNKLENTSATDKKEKIKVYEAYSVDEGIAFRINDRSLFIMGNECKDGYEVKIRCPKTEKNKEKEISKNKETLKRMIISISTTIGSLVLYILACIFLFAMIKNILILLITMHIVYFLLEIFSTFIEENLSTSYSIKSKHSAEHMMVNFLEINNRLPKNIEEVKKCSRFSPKCGTRKLVSKTSVGLIRGILTSNIIGILSLFLNFGTHIAFFIFIYLLLSFEIQIIIIKYNINNSLEMKLSYIIQHANTTRKVRDKDIILAYLVAREWIKCSYPKLYDKQEDIFWKKYVK